jgi:hypothetical protein
MSGCAESLARGFMLILKQDVERLRKELLQIADPARRRAAIDALADLCSMLGLED